MRRLAPLLYELSVKTHRVTILVRGIGDIGSAVAHRLFQEGYAVVLHDVPIPTTTRRGMAFADAIFEGHAALEGIHAVRAHDLARVTEALDSSNAIPVYVRDIGPLLAHLRPAVLVDARMRKHAAPEIQRALAPLTIALGPELVAGRHADVVVETSWEGLGAVITDGASRILAGSHARSPGMPATATSTLPSMACFGQKPASVMKFGRVRRLPRLAPWR